LCELRGTPEGDRPENPAAPSGLTRYRALQPRILLTTFVKIFDREGNSIIGSPELLRRWSCCGSASPYNVRKFSVRVHRISLVACCSAGKERGSPKRSSAKVCERPLRTFTARRKLRLNASARIGGKGWRKALNAFHPQLPLGRSTLITARLPHRLTKKRHYFSFLPSFRLLEFECP